MKTEKINLCLLILIIIGLAYVIFYKPFLQKQEIKQCFDMAIKFEGMRHDGLSDAIVTIEDISSFQKNILSCLSD